MLGQLRCASKTAAEIGPVLAPSGSGGEMEDAPTYQNRPNRESSLAARVLQARSQPMMVPLRMALGMVAFGVSVVALGFALVFGLGNRSQTESQSQGAAREAAQSTNVGKNVIAVTAVVPEAPVAAIIAARADQGAFVPNDVPTVPRVEEVQQASKKSSRAIAGPSPVTSESANTSQKRREVFYDDIPGRKSVKRQ